MEATVTTLVSSLNPSNYGQGVTFTATVTPQGAGTPTGTVNFFEGTLNLGASVLNSSGVATFAISTLAGGTDRITATYNGDTSFASSTSSVLSQVVHQNRLPPEACWRLGCIRDLLPKLSRVSDLSAWILLDGYQEETLAMYSRLHQKSHEFDDKLLLEPLKNGIFPGCEIGSDDLNVWSW